MLLSDPNINIDSKMWNEEFLWSEARYFVAKGM